MYTNVIMIGALFKGESPRWHIKLSRWSIFGDLGGEMARPTLNLTVNHDLVCLLSSNRLKTLKRIFIRT